MSDEAAPTATPASERGRDRRRGSYLVLMMALLAAALALALVARNLRRPVGTSSRPTGPLPVLGHVPTFSLLDQNGALFEPEALGGKVWVADFVFTHCESSCPKLTARMAELQARLVEEGKRRARPLDVKLVSFSVDPENDTPPVLREYAAKTKADPSVWSFVTGPTIDVQNTIVLGFKISAAKVERDAGEWEVLHGNWFVLVDRKGNIRGYYPVEQPEEFLTMTSDVLRLAFDSQPEPSEGTNSNAGGSAP
jgi:protein SCO1/2